MSHPVELLKSLSDAMPLPLLWIGACLGHAFWMTVGLNVLYAWPLHHTLLKFVRKIDILIILCGPLIFLYALDALGDGRLEWYEPSVRQLLAPYTLLCFFLGSVVGPISQVCYW